MSTAPLSRPSYQSGPDYNPFGKSLPHTSPTDTSRTLPQTLIRRRANFQQGRALEILAHAAEYLIDSRMYFIDKPATVADSEATQILMGLSRAVFRDCAEVVPASQRLRSWLTSHLPQRVC